MFFLRSVEVKLTLVLIGRTASSESGVFSIKFLKRVVPLILHSCFVRSDKAGQQNVRFVQWMFSRYLLWPLPVYFINIPVSAQTVTIVQTSVLDIVI